MNRLYAIVRKAHCLGTHHRLAIDALPLVQDDAGRRLVDWLLCHYKAFLQGAVDPDERYCDFHNHILHVRDGYWGGAPRVAHQWYERLQKYLRAERFRDAAHAAGVLTHYITDMLQPLHSVSTDREALIHRPFEWSVDQTYDRIMDTWSSSDTTINLQLSDSPGWLGSLMLHSAKLANTHSDQLIRRYRFQEVIENPSEGLDDDSIRRLSELFGLAITSIAQVLSRAANDAEDYTGYPIPECGTEWALVGATMTAPVAFLRDRLRRRAESVAVRGLAEEFFRTGTLREWLPPEIDIKRRVIAIRHDDRNRRATNQGVLRRRSA